MKRAIKKVTVGRYEVIQHNGVTEIVDGIMPLATVNYSLNLATVTKNRTRGALNMQLYFERVVSPYLTADERELLHQTAKAVEETLVIKFMRLVAEKQIITPRDLTIALTLPYNHRVEVKASNAANLLGIA